MLADLVDKCNRAQTIVQIGRLNDLANGLIQIPHNEQEVMFRMVYRGDRLAGIETGTPGELVNKPVTITNVSVTLQAGDSPRPFREIIEAKTNGSGD
jgi:hypothetical protein